MSAESSVSIEVDADLGQVATYRIKLQSKTSEINVWLNLQALESLRGVGAARWDTRSSIAAGTSAGAHVFWSCQEGRFVVMAGQDDETWDIALDFPESLAQDLVLEIERVLRMS